MRKAKLSENIKFKYQLLRERDHLIQVGNVIKYVEWEDRKFKQTHDEPKIGYSVLLDPHPVFYAWLTTPITEIIEQSEFYLKFKTENSVYELFIREEEEED
jgi:hypothetical protein